VDKPNTNTKTAMEKIYRSPNTYKTEKPLENLAVSGMTVKEFWHQSDKDYMEFEDGKSVAPKHVHLKFPWIMQKIHE
jgi:hypothetical protein